MKISEQGNTAWVVPVDSLVNLKKHQIYVFKNRSKSLMRLISLIIIILTTACGGSDSGGSSVDQELTIDYVENELQLDGYTASGTALIYEDTSSSSAYQFKRVIVSKANSTANGDVLSYAYSLVHPQLVDNTRFVAFYIDIDDNLATGEIIEGIGADRLILDTTIFDSSFDFGEYFIWSDAQMLWENQPISGFSTSITSEELSSTLVVNIPVYVNIEDLLGLTSAKGVMTVRTLDRGDPDDLNAATLTATTVFTFNTSL